MKALITDPAMDMGMDQSLWIDVSDGQDTIEVQLSDYATEASYHEGQNNLPRYTPISKQWKCWVIMKRTVWKNDFGRLRFYHLKQPIS